MMTGCGYQEAGVVDDGILRRNVISEFRTWAGGLDRRFMQVNPTCN